MIGIHEVYIKKAIESSMCAPAPRDSPPKMGIYIIIFS